MTRGRTPFLFALAATLSLCSTGCLGAFIDAGFRELDDSGDDARYAHQSYGAHVVDSMFDDDDDDKSCGHHYHCSCRCN
jgi:hypothetical protein